MYTAQDYMPKDQWERPSLGVPCVSENGNIHFLVEYCLCQKANAEKAATQPAWAHVHDPRALPTHLLPSWQTHQGVPAPAWLPGTCWDKPEMLRASSEGWGGQLGRSQWPRGLQAGTMRGSQVPLLSRDPV